MGKYVCRKQPEIFQHLALKALRESRAQAAMIHKIDIGSHGIGGGDRWVAGALNLGTKVRARGWAGRGCGRGPGGDSEVGSSCGVDSIPLADEGVR